MTNYLIKNTTVLDPTSKWHGKKVSVLIANGIFSIEEKIQQIPANTEELDYNGTYVSPGFCDLYVNINDPGFEYREDINSVANAAIAGGFTTICATADNHPMTQTKAQVEYILNNSKNTAVTILPIGAL